MVHRLIFQKIRDMSRMDRNLKNAIFPGKSEIVALETHRFCRILACFKKYSRNQFWEKNYWRDTLKMCRVRCRVCHGYVAHGIRGRGCRAMAETESPEPVDRPTYPVFPDRTSIRGDTATQRAKQNPCFSAPKRLRQLSPRISRSLTKKTHVF